MYMIDKNNIVTLTRGDSMKLKVNLVFGTFPNEEVWELEEGDTIIFGLMCPNQPFENSILKKVYTLDDYDSEGNIYVWIDPEDTFDLSPGTYYYSIKLVYNSGDELLRPTVDTVVQKTKFNLID